MHSEQQLCCAQSAMVACNGASTLACRVGLTALLLASIAIPASAQVLYQTGFENPPFVDGNLLGQDAWQSTNDPATPGRGIIQTVIAQSGQRAFRCDASVSTTADWFWRNLSYFVNPGATPIIQIEWDMYLDGGSPQKSAGWGIDVYDTSSPVPRRVTAVIVDATDMLKVWNGSTYHDTGVQIGRNNWHAFKVNMNYAVGARKVAVYLDGVRIADGQSFSSGTTNVIADVDLYHIDGGGDDAAYYDNLSISALADSDADGIPNADDQCPGTAPGAPVDGAGCSTLDDDGDGVANDLDQCPGTPSCANPVLPNGCPVDSDEDGVVDGCDNCPNDANPGQEDADGDGFGDACDACPNSLRGDVNGDGTTNGLDLQRFVELVLGDTPVGEELCAADMNNDEQVTIADVSEFVTLLTGAP